MQSSRQYRVNEIFYSVQAEGYNAGRPAAFVRFAGCNLSCPFCDTNHEGHFVMMTADEIEREVDKIAPGNAMVVFTGGEPTLQLSEDEEICKGRYRTVETNGILPVPSWIEWITISPKTRISEERISEADEIKMLYDPACKNEEWMKEVEKTAAIFHIIQLFVQPLADSNGNFSVNEAVEFVKRNPAWRISLQWHKMFGVR